MRVSIDVVVDANALLPFQTSECKTVQDAIGSHVAWPVHLINLHIQASQVSLNKKPNDHLTAQNFQKRGNKKCRKEKTLGHSRMPGKLHMLYCYAKVALSERVIHITMDKDVFGRELKIPIHFEDVVIFCRLHLISYSCIAVYIWHLYNKFKHKNFEKFRKTEMVKQRGILTNPHWNNIFYRNAYDSTQEQPHQHLHEQQELHILHGPLYLSMWIEDLPCLSAVPLLNGQKQLSLQEQSFNRPPVTSNLRNRQPSSHPYHSTPSSTPFEPYQATANPNPNTFSPFPLGYTGQTIPKPPTSSGSSQNLKLHPKLLKSPDELIHTRSHYPQAIRNYQHGSRLMDRKFFSFRNLNVSKVFVSNFPEEWNSRDVFIWLSKWAKIIDLFIPIKRTKIGRRFAFASFLGVSDVFKIVRDIDDQWIGRKVRANLVN
ncbi:hypothetical protein ACS0TY_031225 [Phlomoides rotata]